MQNQNRPDNLNPFEAMETPLDNFNDLFRQTEIGLQTFRDDIDYYSKQQIFGNPEIQQAREQGAQRTAMGLPTDSMVLVDDTFQNIQKNLASYPTQPGMGVWEATPETPEIPETPETQGTGTAEIDPDLGASKVGLGLITKWETGGKGNYSKWGDIGDGAGITAGAHQFTEKSGSLLKVAKKMGYDSVKDPEFKKNIGTEKGKQAQEAVFLEKYAQPAIKKAEKLGIQDPNVKAFMIDTNVNGGLQSVLKAANGDYSLENLINKRQERYDRLAKKPKLKKFKNGWTNRMNDWRKLA